MIWSASCRVMGLSAWLHARVVAPVTEAVQGGMPPEVLATSLALGIVAGAAPDSNTWSQRIAVPSLHGVRGCAGTCPVSSRFPTAEGALWSRKRCSVLALQHRAEAQPWSRV